MAVHAHRQTSRQTEPGRAAMAPESPVAVQPGGNQAAMASMAAGQSTAIAQGSTTDQATAQVTPQPRGGPAPVVPGVQQRTVLGVQIIGEGVSPSALDACAEFVRQTVGQRPDIQKRLERERVALVIVPRNKKMTEVAQFAGLRGKQTVDGRLWDNVRGSGGMRVSGGMWAVGVPEENLVDLGSDTYGTDYDVGMHEFAHTIDSKGVSSAERRQISALYEARKRAGGPWTEAYGASNEREYFAQCTNCFFGTNGRVGNNGAEWLRTNDAAMYAFMISIYGQPPVRDAAGAGRAQADASGAAPAAGVTG